MQLSSEIITASAESVHAGGNHLFWPDNSEESLEKSIKEFGQTTPVLAMETNNGLELIAGQARLRILRELKRPVMTRLVAEADDREKGLLFLTDNAARPMDDGMRLAALRYFRPLMDIKTLTSDILPRLGIKPKSKDAKLLIAWLDLPEVWQNLLTKGNVPLAAGTPLSRMNETDRSAVEPLFTSFSWSRSNAVNMLTWLFETSKMTSTSIGEAMKSAGLDDILNQSLTPKDGIAKLTAAMKTARYPAISQLQADFASAARELTAGSRWRMSQPNNFETGGAELTVQIKDVDQLKRAIKELEAMSEMSPWDTLWNLGKQND